MNTQFIKTLKSKQTILLLSFAAITTLILFLFIKLPKNELTAYLDDLAIVGIVSLGQLIPMLIGGIDFSVQGIYCASAILASHIYLNSKLNHVGLPTIAIIAIILISATLIGAINGFVISHFNMSPLIITFAMNALIEGILYAFTSGISGRRAPIDFIEFVNITVFGIPIVLIFWIVCTLLLAVFLKKSSAGRMLIATGTNKFACHISGINVNMITILSYTLSAFFASLAGMLACANNGISTLTMADNVTIQSLLVVFMAGASAFGGKGSAIKTIFGALAYTSLYYIFKLIPIHTGLREVIMGAILVTIIILSGIQTSFFKKKSSIR